MIWILIGIVWSLISGAIGSVITWGVNERRYGRQAVARAAKDAKLSVELTEAQTLIDHLKADYDALRTQHRALIVHTDNLAARIADDDEAIPALRLQLAEATSKKSEHAQLPKRPRATKIKAAE